MEVIPPGQALAAPMSLAPEIQGNVSALLDAARALVSIEDAEDLETCAGIRRGLKNAADAVTEAVEPMRVPARAALDAILDFRRQALEPINEEETRLKQLASDFLAADAKRRREEEARRQAEAEREERERRQREAKKLQKAGKPEAAEQLLERPVVVAAPVVAAPVVAGAPVRSGWDWKVKDEDQIPRPWMEPAKKRISDFVSDTGETAMRVIPGIEVFEVFGQTIRRK